MTFYCGIDLHTKKSQLCIIDKDGKKVKEGNLNNDLSVIFEFHEPFGTDVHIAIECTINLYLVNKTISLHLELRIALLSLTWQHHRLQRTYLLRPVWAWPVWSCF